MNPLLGNIQISVNPNLYLKNPESSDLGKRILAGGIPLMEELGFEDFTFKKLAISIKSTEASIYRYFESKHLFLLYLNSWYWSWMGYRFTLATTNIDDPNTRLINAIKLLTEKVVEDGNVENDENQKAKLLPIHVHVYPKYTKFTKILIFKHKTLVCFLLT